jgi:hypothetical protein
MKRNWRQKLTHLKRSRKILFITLAIVVFLGVVFTLTELILANGVNSQDKQAIKKSGEALILITNNLNKYLADDKLSTAGKISTIDGFTKKIDGTLTCGINPFVYKALLVEDDKCQHIKSLLGEIKQDAWQISQLTTDQGKIELIISSVDDNQTVAKASDAWSAASVNLNAIVVSSVGEGTKKVIANGVSNYASVWAQLSAADKAHDAAKFNEAKTALSNSHNELIGLSKASSKPLNDLTSQINAKISAFIAQTNTP